MSTEPASLETIAQAIRDHAAEIAAIFTGLALLIGKLSENREKYRAQKREFWEVQDSRLSQREQVLVETVRQNDRETILQLRDDLNREQGRLEKLQDDYGKMLDFAKAAFERKEHYKQRYQLALAQLIRALRTLEKSFPGRYSRQIAELERELHGRADASQFNPPRPKFDPNQPPTEGTG